MTGSADLFDHDGRSPRASINHVTVHDGFTLADLVSYAAQAQSRPTARTTATAPTTTTAPIAASKDRPTIPRFVALRRQLRRNLLACLMLAQGVPLLLAGDEVGNSQSGNNNAYCQDNAVGWVDWSGAGPAMTRT